MLAAAGGVGLAVRAVTGPGDAASLEDVTIGASWIAALACGAAAFWVRSDALLRRLWLAGVLGVAAVLVLRGAAQVFVEHPRTIAHFKANRDAILAAQGWSDDSPMARAYERRLAQAEATGWFGLSNVYGSLAAATTLVFAGLAVAARRHRERVAGPALGVLVGVTMLATSHGKGAIAATVGVGALSLAVAALARRSVGAAPIGDRRADRLGSALGVLCVVGPLAAVAARGLVGERLGELSLLFRWYYMQASLRIIGEHPLLGVGPDGYKQAYLLAKKPISPEDVASPHSILFDWLSTLGLSGAAWCVMLIVLAVAAGRAVARGLHPSDHIPPPRDHDDGPERSDASMALKLLFLAFAGATVVATAVERAVGSPETSVIRFGGLVGGLGLAWVVLRTRSQRMVAAAAGAGALAIIAHCQIELTGVTPGATMFVLMLAGAGTGEGGESPGRDGAAPATFDGELSGPAGTGVQQTSEWAGKLAALAIVGVFAAATGAWFGPVRVWDGALRQSAAAFEQCSELQQRADALSIATRNDADTPDAVAKDLAAALKHPVAPTRDGIAEALSQLRLESIQDSLRTLRRAADALDQAHFPTQQACSRTVLQYAQGLKATAEPGYVLVLAQAHAMARETAERLRSASAWAWLAVTQRAVAEIDGTDPKDAAAASAAAWERAVALAPYDLNYAVQLAQARDAAGQRPKAADAARRALQLHDQSRLDPLRQLTEPQLRAMRALAKE